MSGFQNIVLFGDSITQFWSNYDPDFFESNNLINKGISGQTTSQMLDRFDNDVIKLQPKTVVILAGINDIAENNGPIAIDAVLHNVHIMVEKALQYKIEVLLCSLLPANRFYWNPKIQPASKVLELNSLLKNYANTNALIFVDFFTAMVDTSNGLLHNYGTDGVHPNLEGYLKMKSILDPYLKS
ncbi:GDSL-type esterase/lipase family protein [Flavobacterium sp.]|jgi:lysophospholipase L1-like esterase|uniref:GDSL-type esterase/lipase family protein n=1 Tax=Flavobacterium sp. TaxID=239 RepID=UPI0037C1971D